MNGAQYQGNVPPINHIIDDFFIFLRDDRTHVYTKKSWWQKTKTEYRELSIQERYDNFISKFKQKYPWVECLVMEIPSSRYPVQKIYLYPCNYSDEFLGSIFVFTEIIYSNYNTLETIGFEKVKIYIQINGLGTPQAIFFYQDQPTQVLAKLLGIQ